MKKGSSTNNGAKNLLFSSLFGAVAGILLFVLLVSAFSLVCMIPDNPHPFILPLCFLALYSSAFFAGFISSKRSSSKTLLCAALCGTILMLLIWMLSASLGLAFGIKNPSSITFIYRLLIIPTSCLGALIEVSSSAKKTKKRRRKF